MKKSKPEARQSTKAQKPKQGSIESISSFFNSAYQRIPVIPFFDRPSSALLIVCIAAFVLFTAFVFFTAPSPLPSSQTVEAPLLKNAQISLVSGERYAYSLSMGNQTEMIYYLVSNSSSCPGTLVTELEGQSQRQICLSQSGNVIGNVTDESNLPTDNDSIVLFSPWMLAASQNFSWEVDQVFTAGTTQISIPTYFNSTGLVTIAGRNAFAVSITSDQPQSVPATMYIDSQKRVLLSTEISNITIKLVDAPFALDWNASNCSD